MNDMYMAKLRRKLDDSTLNIYGIEEAMFGTPKGNNIIDLEKRLHIYYNNNMFIVHEDGRLDRSKLDGCSENYYLSFCALNHVVKSVVMNKISW